MNVNQKSNEYSLIDNPINGFVSNPTLRRSRDRYSPEINANEAEDYDKETDSLIEKKAPKVEEVKERKTSFYIEMVVILTVLFFAESSRGMVVPSLNYYVDSLTTNAASSEKWLGVLIGAYSVGRLIGSTVLGWMYNKFGINWTMQFALTLSVIGNGMYVMGSVTNIWVLLFSRMLTGFSTGTLSIVRAFVAERTTKEERTRWVSYSTAVQYIGFALVPGFGAFFSKINFQVGMLPVNAFTTPGYILVLCNALVIPAVFFFIPNQKGPEESKEAVSGIDKKELRLFYYGLGLFILLNMVGRGVLSVLETTVSPTFKDILMDMSDPDSEPDYTKLTAIMLFVLGVIGLVIFFLLDPLCKRIKEPTILNAGFMVVAAGSLFLISYGKEIITVWQFAIGSIAILSIASPIVQTLVVSAFSKILGSKPQGTMMGYITSAGSVGRIIMPPLTGAIGMDASYGISVALSILCAILIFVYTKMVERHRSRVVFEVV
eukprot:TRINITY_DN4807_c0_g1_i1.p1 TRINITY_DN4807_c0_g1~~TRINITY_DN4807_c0_g1_i1.p1  ORF type:complete len:489 (+),score=148.14 TRINITY_DN4807_c0_g1_i1:155-1621(+)